MCLCGHASPKSAERASRLETKTRADTASESQGHQVTELPLVPRAQCSLLFKPSTDVQSLPTPRSTAPVHNYLHRNAHSNVSFIIWLAPQPSQVGRNQPPHMLGYLIFGDITPHKTEVFHNDVNSPYSFKKKSKAGEVR